MATVLFVDDEASILNGIRLSLRTEPYRVVTVDSGLAALEIVRDERVDVVVSDASMPGMSGAELLERIRATCPDTVRIMLTGEADLRVTKRLIEEGKLYRFLSKPVNRDELRSTLRNALHMKSLADEATALRGSRSPRPAKG